MSEHDDVERLLARYRPAGPAASLRQRITTTATSSGGARHQHSSRMRWLAAAAALATAAALHMAASRTFDSLAAARSDGAAQARAATIDDMTALLGGGPEARSAAEHWFSIRQATAANEASALARLEATWIR